MSDDNFDISELANVPASGSAGPESPPGEAVPVKKGARHIGCPLSWFNLVFPIVRGKNELAVALFLYRLRAVNRSRTVSVTNGGLLAELKIDRFAKYRAIKRLEDAGIVAVDRRNKKALKITFR
jgi:hypothetical protein